MQKDSMRQMRERLAHLCMPLLYCVCGYLLFASIAMPLRLVYAGAIDDFLSDFEASTVLGSPVSYDSEALKPKPAPEPTKKTTPTVVSTDAVPKSIEGDQVGQLSCERIGLDAPVMWGDTEYEYSYGAGQDTGSSLPGFGRLVLLSGHNTTFFSPLEFIEVGDVIHYDTAYGKYEYTVRRVEVYMEQDLQALLNAEDIDKQEQLILYTCFPFHPVESRRTDRLTVFAERTLGPDVR